MWQFWNVKASHRQINGSSEVMFDTLLGGTVLFLPVKRLRAGTSYRHPRWLWKWPKILYFGRVFGLASKTVELKDLQWQCYMLFGRVCDCYWEWPWPWQWSEQWLPLQVSRMAQHYDLDLGWLWWLFSLDLDWTPSTVSPITNGKYTLRAF